jgi:hypothetical protein
MKKTVFLALLVIATLLCACTTSGLNVCRTGGMISALTSPSPPTPLKDDPDRGVDVTISKRASLNIDVEGILDYVQGTPSLVTDFQPDDNMYPWIRWNWSF